MTPENIYIETCLYYNLDKRVANLPIQTRRINKARQVSHFLSKELTKYSNTIIGSEIGGKSRATVIYSHETILGLIETDKELNKEIEEIKGILNARIEPNNKGNRK